MDLNHKRKIKEKKLEISRGVWAERRKQYSFNTTKEHW